MLCSVLFTSLAWGEIHVTLTLNLEITRSNPGLFSSVELTIVDFNRSYR